VAFLHRTEALQLAHIYIAKHETITHS